MERKALLLKYVKSALWRLRFEQFVRKIQTGLFVSALLAVLIVAVSRLFVLPFYGRIALVVAILTVITAMLVNVFNRTRQKEAVRRLDGYMPDNLLITAMDVNENETHLALALIKAAESKVITAFEGFKKRQKFYLNAKMFSGLLVVTTVLVLLLLFPSEAQLEAGALVKEKEIIEEVKKEVQQLMEKEALPKVKKELQELAEKLKEAETSEMTLQELVKKQKEFRLKEQRLADKKDDAEKSGDPSDALTDAEEQELGELGKLSDTLAENIGNAHSALNKIGKVPALPALANVGNTSTANGATPGTSLGQDQGQSDEAGQEDTKDDNQGQGQGQGQDQGQGQGQDQGQGQGQDQSQGQDQDQDQDQGSGSSAAGKGSGGRDLLSIPYNRVGEKGDPSVVGGNLGEGEFIEERETEELVEKGAIRPYKEVVGDYKEAYLKSTDKMQLPPDLQHILSDYFSSVE